MSGTTMLHNSGPFYMKRLPYRLGFRWYEEMRLTKSVPDESPTVIGYQEWKSTRYRLYWKRVPLGRWRSGMPKFRSHRSKS